MAQADPKAVPVPFTLADRERLITMEQRLNYLEKCIDHLEKRMDRLEAELISLRKEMTAEIAELRKDTSMEIAELRREIRSYVFTVLGLLAALIGALVALTGYLLYERNKLLIPLLRGHYEHEARLARLESLLPPAPATGM